MAEDGIPGSKSKGFDPRGGRVAGHDGTVANTGSDNHSDGPSPAWKEAHPDTAKDNSSKSTGSQSLQGADGKLPSPDVLPGKTADKSQNTPIKSDPKPPIDIEKVGANVLPKVSLENTRTPVPPKTEQPNQPQQKPAENTKFPGSLQNQSKNEQAGTGTKVSDQPARNNPGSVDQQRPAPESRSQTNDSRSPQQIESHASQPQPARAQEVAPQSATNPAVEAKSDSRPVPVAIPIDSSPKQTNPAGAKSQNLPEAAPIAVPKDPSGRPAQPANTPAEARPIAGDPKTSTSEAKPNIGDPKANTGDTKTNSPDAKTGSGADQSRGTESRSTDVDGNRGEKGVAGADGKLIPEQSTKEADVRSGGSPKDSTVAQEATVKETPGIRHEPFSPHVQGEHAGINTSRPDGIDAIIEKNKEHVAEGMILPTGKNIPSEQSISASTPGRDGKQESQHESTHAGGDESSHGLPGGDFLLGSIRGTSSDRGKDNVAGAGSSERIILKVENLAVNLGDKNIVAKFLSVLEQIKSGKVTARDPESTAFAHAVLSMKETNLGKIEAALKALDSSQLKSMMSDMLPPEQAQDRKLARWDLPLEKEKTAKLEAENVVLKRDSNFLKVITVAVKELFANFMPRQQNLSAEASATEIVEDITAGGINKKAVEQFMFKADSYLNRYAAGEDIQEDEEIIDQDDVSTSPTKNTQSQFGATRQTHVIEAVTTCEEIATSKLGDSRLSELVARINDIEATLIDGRPVKRELQPGEVVLLPTEAECMHYLKPAGT